MAKKPGISKRKRLFLIVWIASLLLILAAIFLIGLNGEKHETITQLMKDAVLHEDNRVNFFGLTVNPAVISAFTVTGILLFAAALIRIFAIPKFKQVPGKFQLVIEMAVEFFSNMAKSNSPHKTGFVAAYIFSAGIYIFFSTVLNSSACKSSIPTASPWHCPPPLRTSTVPSPWA